MYVCVCIRFMVHIHGHTMSVSVYKYYMRSPFDCARVRKWSLVWGAKLLIAYYIIMIHMIQLHSTAMSVEPVHIPQSGIQLKVICTISSYSQNETLYVHSAHPL